MVLVFISYFPNLSRTKSSSTNSREKKYASAVAVLCLTYSNILLCRFLILFVPDTTENTPRTAAITDGHRNGRDGGGGGADYFDLQMRCSR